MNFQYAELPRGAAFTAATPVFSDRTVPAAICRRHLSPRGKFGRLVVHKGRLRFVWEDTGELLDADPEHPVIIPPGRFHHVEITGPVQFNVEFYQVPGVQEPCNCGADKEALRPGEAYMDDAYLVTK